MRILDQEWNETYKQTKEIAVVKVVLKLCFIGLGAFLLPLKTSPVVEAEVMW